jgi:hypothetical protein
MYPQFSLTISLFGNRRFIEAPSRRDPAIPVGILYTLRSANPN